MIAKFHILSWTFGLLSFVLIVLLAGTHLKLASLRGEIRYANDIIWTFDTERDMAAKGNTTEAADILWKLYFPSLHWSGAPEPFHAEVARLVEERRRTAVKDVIVLLRAKTGEDIGSEPEAWILKYGGELSKDQLTAMSEPSIGDGKRGGAEAPNN